MKDIMERLVERVGVIASEYEVSVSETVSEPKFYIAFLTKSSEGPIVYGNSYEEVKEKMTIRLKSFNVFRASLLISEIARNEMNAQPKKEDSKKFFAPKVMNIGRQFSLKIG